MQDIIDAALPWLPLIIQVLVLVYIGQFLKKRVLTKEAALKNRVVHVFKKFMPMIPLVLGGAMGCIPKFPTVQPYFSPDLWGGLLQGVVAGIVSTFAYSSYRTYAKQRGWKPIELVSDESIAPKPPTEDDDEMEDTPVEVPKGE